MKGKEEAKVVKKKKKGEREKETAIMGEERLGRSCRVKSEQNKTRERGRNRTVSQGHLLIIGLVEKILVG